MLKRLDEVSEIVRRGELRVATTLFLGATVLLLLAHRGTRGMNDHLVMRYQFQRLDQRFAENVVIEKAASTCSQHCDYIIRSIVRGKDNSFDPGIGRHDSAYEIARGYAVFFDAEQPDALLLGANVSLSLCVQR